MNTEYMKQSLYGGVWGTAGQRFTEASDMMRRRCNGSYGVLMHSKEAAYETVLRSLNLGYGDCLLCAAYSDRMDSEIAAAVGITPFFADIEKETLAISARMLETVFSRYSEVRAITLDYQKNVELSFIKDICRKNNCPLIINAGTALDAVFEFEGIYAVVFDLGVCGAAVTGTEENYESVFAWHHCGHAPGTGSSISFDRIAGGDMRVSEWQAIEAMEILEEQHPVTEITERGYIAAWENPVFRTEYFRKITGSDGEYRAEDYPNARALTETKRR